MELKTVKIGELKLHPKNPRVHPESAIDKLVKSIKEFGWTNPVLASKDGVVLAGHARIKAAEKAGIEKIPVIYLPLEGAKADAYLIADNRLQDETDWDVSLLKDLVNDLIKGLEVGEIDLDMEEAEGFDFGAIGLDDSEVSSLLDDIEIIEDPDVKPSSNSKYEKGSHDSLPISIGQHVFFLSRSRKAERDLLTLFADAVRQSEDEGYREQMNNKIIDVLVELAESEGFSADEPNSEDEESEAALYEV